jgi:signal transduction histidine kinase
MRTVVNQGSLQSTYNDFVSRLKAHHCLYLCLAGIMFIYRSCIMAATATIGVATYLMYAINRQSLSIVEADKARLKQSEKIIRSQQKSLNDINKQLVQTSRECEATKARLREVEQELMASKARLHQADETDADRLKSRLLQAQKMESVGRLAGGLAHDFNNLLSIMLGHAEIGLADPSIKDLPVHNTLTQILKAGERVHTLTQQLLAFGRKQVPKREKLDLNHIILDFQPMLSRLMGEAIEISTHLAHDPWQVFMDITQTEQILLNVAINARDAMPQGGCLTIRTANHSVHEPLPVDVDLPAGEYVELTISDTGFGIAEGAITHIFEPFFTTKEQGKGTGLGLSTVYEIVTQHGGAICAESSPGQGATFKIFLPRCIDAAQHEAKRINEPDYRFAGPEAILMAKADSIS